MKTFNIYEIDMKTDHKDIYALFEKGHYVFRFFDNLLLEDLTEDNRIREFVDCWFDGKEKDRQIELIGPFNLQEILQNLIKEANA